MEKKTKNWTKWIYWFTFAMATIIFYKTVDNIGQITNWLKGLLSILAPFAAGILISYILYIPCKKIENTYKNAKKIKILSKKARALSIFTVYMIVLVLIIILINFIFPPIIQSIIDLANNFGYYYDIAVKNINELPEDSFWKTEVITRIMKEIENIDIKQIINVELLTQYAQGALTAATKVFDIFVAIIVSIYILNSRSQIIGFIKRLAEVTFSDKTYKSLSKYFDRTNEIFFHFLSSQLLDAFVVGILTSVAMSILGIKYAILLGFMIGVFNLIPYVGAIIAVIIAGIITVFTGGIPQAIWMLIIVTILQQIDANIINPKIVGNSLKINPLLVILAITVGGAYFGIIGMFLAVPVIAIIKVIVEDYIDYRKQIKQ
ncbi:MAG: AI-2E family transporter [Clostridiaceae bacterium]|nr:AI-2E family transporter [Clostridiaceae bacterium]